MENVVLTLLAIYLGLSILVGLGSTAFWIWVVRSNIKDRKKLDEIDKHINETNIL